MNALHPDRAARVEGQLSRLFRRDSLYMILWTVQLLCAGLFTPFITRQLGSGQFGVVATAIAMMQVLFVLAGFGMYSAIQREFTRPDGARDAYRLITVAVCLAVMTTALAFATVQLWAVPLGMAHETTALRLAVLWAGASAITDASLALLRSADRLLAFCIVSLLQSVVAEAAGLVLVAAHNPRAVDYLFGRVAVQVVTAIAALALTPPASVTSTHWRTVRAALGFAVPLIPALLSDFILATADRLIVQGYLGNDEVARYQVAYNVASMPILLLAALHTVWMPRFFALPEGAERSAVLTASRDTLYRLLVPVLAGFAVGAPLVLRVWAPPTYHPEQLYGVVCVVIVTSVPFAAQLALSRGLIASGRSGPVGTATALAAVVNLLMNWIAVPRFGLLGSALATLSAYVMLYAMLRWWTRGDQDTHPLGTRMRLALASTIVVCVGSVLVPDDTLAFVIRGVISAAAVVWFFRLLFAVSRRPDLAGRGREARPGVLTSDGGS